MKSPVRKSATLREQVFELVLTELRNGEFAPGTRITEEALAKRLEISRTPIREALGQLTRQGVLLLRAGGGYLVPSPTVDEIRHIIAVRLLLEPPAVKMAASEYGSAEVERLSKAIQGEENAVGKIHPAAFARANEEFRHALFDGLSNKALSRLISQFDSHLHFIRAVTLKDTTLRQEIVDRQVKIRDAVKRRDADRAEVLWRAYLRFTEEVLVQALRELQKAGGESVTAVEASA
jgi:DNA-binding GntR family transcriptional regulator